MDRLAREQPLDDFVHDRIPQAMTVYYVLVFVSICVGAPDIAEKSGNLVVL